MTEQSPYDQPTHSVDYLPPAHKPRDFLERARTHAGLAAASLVLLAACGNTAPAAASHEDVADEAREMLARNSTSTALVQPETTNAPPTPQPEAPRFVRNPPVTIEQGKDQLPSPEPGKKITPKGITLHWWSFDDNGGLSRFRQELLDNKSCGSTGCSVQFAVTKTGVIHQMMSSPLEKAYHAYKANSTTIGIEIEGTPQDFATSGEQFNKPKFEAVVSLSTKLVADYGIAIEGEATCSSVTGIHSHHEYNACNGDNKADVGDAYTRRVIDGVKSMNP